MKSTRTFMICIAVAIVVLFALQISLPARFSWKATYAHADKNPFGCYAFDSIMATAMPHYRHSSETLWQLSRKHGRTGVLIVAERVSLGRMDLEAMDSLLSRGGIVLVAGISDFADDTLFMSHYGICTNQQSTFVLRTLREQYSHRTDTIFWDDTSRTFGYAEYLTCSLLNSGTVCYNPEKTDEPTSMTSQNCDPQDYYEEEYYEEEVTEDSVYVDSTYTDNTADADYATIDADYAADGADYAESTLTTDSFHLDRASTAARLRVGRGWLIVSSSPKLFSNFGVLDPQLSPLVHRFMSCFRGMPVVRTEAYAGADLGMQQSDPTLSYLLGQKPLRTAVYMAVALLLLFMATTARRQQRAIPVMQPPQNHSLDFARLIGTLYYERKDHADLMRKKFGHMAETLRTELGIDIATATDDERAMPLLASRTGLPQEQLRQTMGALRLCYHSDASMTEQDMRRHIDAMNDILNRL